MVERGRGLSRHRPATSAVHDLSTAETIVKYDGYLKRQQADVERSRRDEARPIPGGFPYERIPGLSREMVQRFGEVEPSDARPGRSRFPGVTPAAVALVGAYLERFSHDATGVQRAAGEAGPEGGRHAWTPRPLNRSRAYYHLLEFWNQKVNLTAFSLTDAPDEAIDRLLIEPLVVAQASSRVARSRHSSTAPTRPAPAPARHRIWRRVAGDSAQDRHSGAQSH